MHSHTHTYTHTHTHTDTDTYKQLASVEPSVAAPRDTDPHTTTPTPRSKASNGSWSCADVFTHAGERFKAIGVKAYTRYAPTLRASSEDPASPPLTAVDPGQHRHLSHTHQGEDKTYWQSGPRESWEEIVQDTGRNLAQEMIDDAHNNGARMIAYHYTRCHAYWSKAMPEWCAGSSGGRRASCIAWPGCPNIDPVVVQPAGSTRTLKASPRLRRAALSCASTPPGARSTFRSFASVSAVPRLCRACHVACNWIVARFIRQLLVLQFRPQFSCFSLSPPLSQPRGHGRGRLLL